MKAIKTWTLALLALLAVAFTLTACESDDDNQGDAIPEELIGTWNFADDNYAITFKSDGTGYMTFYSGNAYAQHKGLAAKAEVSRIIHFTYFYVASTRTIVMTDNSGDKEVWKLVSASGSQLIITDSDGDTYTAAKASDDGDSPATGIDITKIYGTWRLGSGILTMTFDAEGNYTIVYGDGASRSTTYTYNEDTHVITDGDGFTMTVVSLTDDELTVDGFEINDEPKRLTLQRVGSSQGGGGTADISSVFNKKWALYAGSESVWIIINSDGTGTTGDDEGTYDFKWTYVASTSTFRLESYVDGEFQVSFLKVIAITENTFRVIITDTDSDEESDVTFYLAK